MAHAVIYGAPDCADCISAKALLGAKSNVELEFVDVVANPSIREEMTKMLGGDTTLPQIVVEGRHVGSLDRLKQIDATGALDQILTVKKACCRGLPPDQCSDTHRGMGKNAHREEEKAH